ncbi:MAG: histidine phosphatase family protein [Actinomycetota bacterium]
MLELLYEPVTDRDAALELGLRQPDTDAIFTSDAAEALETVAIAFFGSDVPIFHDWRLRDCDYGVLSGAPAQELEPEKHVDVPYPGGESYRDVVTRIDSFLHDLRRGWDGKRVLVVSHAAPGLAIEHLLDGVPLEGRRFDPPSRRAFSVP